MNEGIHQIKNFLDYKGSLTVVTIVALAFTYYQYVKQRQDRRCDAARVIYREIQQMENQVSEIRSAIESARLSLTIRRFSLVTDKNWRNLQHLLSKVLPENIMIEIQTFYITVDLLSESLKSIYDAWYTNESETREVRYEFVANALERYLFEKLNPLDKSVNFNPVSDASPSEDYAARIRLFLNLIPNPGSDSYGNLYYVPVKHFDDADKYLVELDKLSTSTVGDKLLKASMPWYKRIIDLFKI